jgi:hypothetical protein
VTSRFAASVSGLCESPVPGSGVRPRTPNTSVGVVCELFRDWAGPLGPKGQEITNWYFTEVPKVTDKVGIAEAEAARAEAALKG